MVRTARVARHHRCAVAMMATAAMATSLKLSQEFHIKLTVRRWLRACHVPATRMADAVGSDRALIAESIASEEAPTGIGRGTGCVVARVVARVAVPDVPRVRPEPMWRLMRLVLVERLVLVVLVVLVLMLGL